MSAALSARDGAGLYLVRRARTLTAPHQVRLVATAFLAVLAVDLARIHLGEASAGGQVHWPRAGAEVLTYLAVALVLWRPLAGLGLAGVALAAGLAAGGTGTEPLLLLVTGASVGVRGGRRTRWVYLAAVLAYLAASAAVQGEQVAFVLGWFGGAAVVGAAAGWGVRMLHRQLDQGGRRLAEVNAEDARLRADERAVLARELHDVVTHQLSTISLQVMSHVDSADPDELRRVLRKVGRCTDSGLTELRLLVRVLRDHPATAGGPVEVRALSERVPPTAAAAGWARRLLEAGFDPTIDIPAQADRLEMTVQSTLTRTLEVTGDNLIRHAPPRSRCSIAVSVNPTQVIIRVVSPLATPPPADHGSLGWGLRGLRERVDLTGGTLTAAPSSSPAQDPEWVVVVTLPRD